MSGAGYLKNTSHQNPANALRFDLGGKIAIVTGGSSGIGRTTSLLLAVSGAKVIINCENAKVEEAEEVREEINSLGAEAEIFPANISIPEQVEDLFQHVKNKYNRLDILVNNAGITKDKLLLTMEITDWEKVYQVNLKGAFLCTRLAAAMMIPNHSGKIINLASIAAIKSVRGQTNYAATKGGLVSFTRACAVELGGKGIQVNAVLPGVIATELSMRARKKASDLILARIPVKRFGNTLDVAELVLFLASDHADYITGQAISVDGGLSIS